MRLEKRVRIGSKEYSGERERHKSYIFTGVQKGSLHVLRVYEFQKFFFVAGNATFKPLCRSVGRSVSPSVRRLHFTFSV